MTDPLRSALRKIAAEKMDFDPAHDLAHLDRVWRNSLELSKYEPVLDWRVLIAAAYLHDLVNLPKDSKDRHLASRLSAERAEPLLGALEYSVSEIAQVRHAIEAHSFSAGIEPNSTEACVLRDADRLESLGAIGLARWFAVSGQMGRPFYDPDDPFAQSRSPDDTPFALDHWQTKLNGLADHMLTSGGKALALKRHAVMEAYLDDLAQELGVTAP